MKLKKIIENLGTVRKIDGKTSMDIKGLACDSKVVRDDYIFIAIKGSRFNGNDFINEAVDRGASTIILESSKEQGFTYKRGPTYIYVDDVRLALSQVSLGFYGDVSKDMFLAGITGTNGKTTTSYLLESLFKIKFGQVGLIGTINYRFGNRVIPAINTTPGVLDIYSLLSNMKDSDIGASILEVSSHALDQGRVDTIAFDIAIFTNLTREHMDYHVDLDSYLRSKMKLFTKIKENGYAIINADEDCAGKIIDRVRKEKNINIITYGIEKAADVTAKDIQYSFKGVRFEVSLSSKLGLGASWNIASPLIGKYNVYNILASVACGIAMGMNKIDITSGIERVKGLPGRLESINCGQDFSVFVDYAHTGDGLKNVLSALKELSPSRILTVFGCGGDKDRSKRPIMGQVSSGLSDRVFITSDNPRTEDPIEIINEVISGIGKGKNNYVVEVDRHKAIEKALLDARKGDIVLVAGKGHETYQIFKNFTAPFDDREVVKKILDKR